MLACWYAVCVSALTLLCIGTSATTSTHGGQEERRQVVAEVAGKIFGAPVKPEHVITESLRRITPSPELPGRAHLAAAIAQGVPTSISRAYVSTPCRELNMGLNRVENEWVR